MDFIKILMVTFSMLGALDRIFGNRFGLGKQFEKGIMLLGTMFMSMLGMIVISPLIAEWLTPAFSWFYDAFHIDPSIIPSSLFANDMGGAPLSNEIAKDSTIGMFNALVTSSMMGCTISFTLPYSVNAVNAEKHDDMFLGFLCGILTIPIGCFVAGLFCDIGVLELLFNLLPLIIFSVIIAVGLIFFKKQSIFVFKILAAGMKIIITIGLALGIFTFITGIETLKGLATFMEGADVCINAATIMSGAFPLIYTISKILDKPLRKLGSKLGINEKSAMGFVCSLATNATTFELMNEMDRKGVVLNSAFAISASFTFAGHLAFTLAFDANYIAPMIIGKLVSGVCAFIVAIFIVRLYSKKAESDTTL